MGLKCTITHINNMNHRNNFTNLKMICFEARSAEYLRYSGLSLIVPLVTRANSLIGSILLLRNHNNRANTKYFRLIWLMFSQFQ